MKRGDILLWGDLCIDKNNIAGKEFLGPGGSAYFCSKIFKKLDWEPMVVSPRGEDYDDNWLGRVSVYPEEPVENKTLVYKNIYNDKGKRTLFGENRDKAYFINPLSLPEEYFKKAEAVIVCPIDNNISSKNIKDLRKRAGDKIISCLPQGFFRRYEKDGRVFQEDWQEEEKIVPLLDLIFVSEEDGKNIDGKAEKWSLSGPTVAVTRAERGCSIYEEGKRKDFKAFRIKKIADPVGAGDVFSAAFTYYYLLSQNTAKSAVFANAAAGLSLYYNAMDMDLDIKGINEFLKNPENY